MQVKRKRIIGTPIIERAVLLLLLVILFLAVDQIHAQEKEEQPPSNPYELTLEQLSKIQITSATKAVQNLSDIPSTIFIITAADIKERGYCTLEEALSDLPGIQFRNALGINSYVFQRGLPNQNNLTLALIDGIQVNELNSGGFYGGGQYNLSNVERIEVVYGPASVAYGTNAVTGIINIITKSALIKQSALRALIGSFNTVSGDLSYCYTDEDSSFGILFSGMVKKTDKADLKGREGDYNWTEKMENFEHDYSFDLKIQTRDFIGGTNVLYKQASTSTWAKSVGTIYSDYGTSWNILFMNAYLKYNNEITEKLTLSSILYHRNATVLSNTVYYVVDTAQIGYYRPNTLTGFENILNYGVSDYFFITGGLTLEYERLAKNASISISDSPERMPPTPETPDMENNFLISIFIEPQLTPRNNLAFSGGVRFDHSNVYDQVVTPRAGLTYKIQNHLFRCSYAEAFRAPKPWDYSDGIGNSSLMPEKMKSLEAAVTVAIADKYKVDVVGYINTLDHAFVKEVSQAGYRWMNSGEVNTDGVELYLRYVSKQLQSSVNYTFNQSYNEFHDVVPEISKHSGNATVTYSFGEYIKFNLRANYIGKRENPKVIATTNSIYIDPCFIFHSALSLINFKGFDVQVAVKNVFNKEYYHTSNRDPDRYRQPQRTILVSAGYTLNN